MNPAWLGEGGFGVEGEGEEEEEEEGCWGCVGG